MKTHCCGALIPLEDTITRLNKKIKLPGFTQIQMKNIEYLSVTVFMPSLKDTDPLEDRGDAGSGPRPIQVGRVGGLVFSKVSIMSLSSSVNCPSLTLDKLSNRLT